MSVYPKPFFINAFSLWLLTVLTISGCASLPDAAAPDASRFTVQGRLGVRTAEDSFASSFSWAQGSREYHIELWGPLGQGRTRLIGEVGPGGPVTVYAANGEVQVEPDSQRAMQRWLGVAVPVDALTHWIQGQVATGIAVDAETQDDQGDLQTLSQLGWELAFSRYREVGDGRRVPGRIVANRGEVKVTLIPKEWTFSSTYQ